MVFKRLSNTKKTEEHTTHASRVEQALLRYKQCRHLQPGQEQFTQGFNQLQNWQTLRLVTSHKDLLSDPRYGRAAHFLLHEVYGGGHLGAIADEIQKTANKAGRLLPKGIFATAALALELNALTIEIDESIVEYMMQHQWVPGQVIDSKNYCHALQQGQLLDKRTKQLDLCQELAEAVDQYLHSKSVRLGLKMSAGIAESAGVQNLHEFLLTAFDHLKEVGKVSAVIQHIGQIEIKILEDVALHNNPFSTMDVAQPVAPIEA